MRIVLMTAIFALSGLFGSGEALAQAMQATNQAPLPVPVSNNAVTGVAVGGNTFVVSFAGIGTGKTYRDVRASTFVFNARTAQWSEAGPLPGGAGRLAATAASVGTLAFVFGGYTVAANGTEVSTPWVHAFDPVTAEFESRQRIPVPVDDAVSVVYQNRYIYLISGWHDDGNVNLVQRYDSQADSWVQATPVPGHAVFGHAGGIVDGRIMYCDGVTIKPRARKKRAFVANNECFLGIIDSQDSRRIDWRTTAPHPGLPRYRMAAAGIPGRSAILFSGGSDNPYNYDGLGYDGRRSQPAEGGLLYDLQAHSWKQIEQSNAPSMDHRGLVAVNGGWLTVGGMLSGQKVTDRVTLYTLDWE